MVLAVAPAIVPSAVVTVSYTPGASPIRDAAGNNAAALVTQATTNSSAADPPLGAAAWSLWIDARDYESVFSSGDTVAAALTPRVGAGVGTPFNSPTAVIGAIGIGNRLAFKHVAATVRNFMATWLASIMNGWSKPGTIAIRAQRGAAAAAVWAGFGEAASGTNSYFEVALAAGGQAIMRKNDGTTTATKSGGTTLASTSHTVIITTNAGGTQGFLYVDGVLESTFNPTPLDLSPASARVTIDHFGIGNSGRLVGGGGLDGAWQVCGVSSNVVDATQVATIHAAMLASDIAVSAGAQVYYVGDSLFAYSGVSLRQKMYDMYIAAGKNIDLVGSFAAGAFADNQHSAQNGVEIASIRARALSEVGTGKAFPNVKLVCLLGAVNDLNNVGVLLTDVQTAYTTAVTDIHAAITATQPTARIAIYTIRHCNRAPRATRT